MGDNFNNFMPNTSRLIWVNTGSGNGLLPDSTKPFPDLMVTFHQWGTVVFTWFGIPFHQIWKPHHALINLRICYCNGMGKYALVVSAHCVNLNIYDVRTLMLPWQFYRMLEYQVNDLKHISLILLVILCLYVYSRPLEERQVWWLPDIFRDSNRVWKHQVSQPIMMKNHTYFMYLLHLYVPYFTHHPHPSSSLLSLNSFVANVIC